MLNTKIVKLLDMLKKEHNEVVYYTKIEEYNPIKGETEAKHFFINKKANDEIDYVSEEDAIELLTETLAELRLGLKGEQ